MTRSNDRSDEADAEQAINRVLEAEHQARDRVAHCQAQAEARLEAARERARRIAARTDARITSLRRQCEQQITEQVARLKDSAEAVRCQPLSGDARATQLGNAMRQLAARLTGGD